MAEPEGVYRAEPVVDLWAGLGARAFPARRNPRARPCVRPTLERRHDRTRACSALIRHLPAGLTELYLHPATRGGFEGAADGYLYEEEFAALIDSRGCLSRFDARSKAGGFTDFSSAP